MHLKRLSWLLPLALASCGTLPEPFYGYPGANAVRLATPPAPGLMVPTPGGALLDDASAKLYAEDLATDLANLDIPSIAGPAATGDWRLTITASLNGASVIPSYDIIGPDKKTYGHQSGLPVAAAAWANGDTQALAAAANADSPALEKTLAAINARIQGSNPNSLENRTPRIYVGNVTGAPGDGNTTLPLDLARDLAGPNLQVITNPARADFTVTAKVKAEPDKNGQTLITLNWSVTDANHRKIGQVTQLHDLGLSEITPYWGDIAAAAATEAATGIAEVVNNATLHK